MNDDPNVPPLSSDRRAELEYRVKIVVDGTANILSIEHVLVKMHERKRAVMNEKWLNLAGELLGLASSSFSNRVCNDWKWPEHWSPADRLSFAEAMVRDNVRKPVGDLTAEESNEVKSMAGGVYGPPDWWVMIFLGNRLAGGK
jgi:hypothetical protein